MDNGQFRAEFKGSDHFKCCLGSETVGVCQSIVQSRREAWNAQVAK